MLVGFALAFHHMIDIVPTILEATGIQAPELVNGIKQKPIEGVSIAYTFDKANATAPSKRETQYFEMLWQPRDIPRGLDRCDYSPCPALGYGTGQDAQSHQRGIRGNSYNIAEDYSENNDLAASNPSKLKELQALFLTEAAKYNVFPMDNSLQSRLLTARPSAVSGRTEFTYMGENIGIPVGNAPDILDKDYTITSRHHTPRRWRRGRDRDDGWRFGGYALLLSHSFNWWFKSSLFKSIGLGLLILGLLLSVVR